MRAQLLGLLLLLGATPEAVGTRFAVVVPQDSPVHTLSQDEIAAIFLAKASHYADGSRAAPMEVTDSGLRSEFYRIISGKSLAQLNSYWTTLIFTGKGRPPKQFSDHRTLVEMLRRNPQAISYVPVDAVSDGLRVIHTVD